MDYYRYSHVGIVFILTFLGFFLSGNYLDQKLHTAPLFLFLGVVIGFSMSMYVLMQEINKK